MTNDRDWAAQATQRLESVVGILRDRSVRPVLRGVRYLIVGAMASIVGLAIVVTVVIGTVRIFDVDVFRGRVWATYLLLGGMLTIAGAFLLRLSTKSGRDHA